MKAKQDNLKLMCIVGLLVKIIFLTTGCLEFSLISDSLSPDQVQNIVGGNPDPAQNPGPNPGNNPSPVPQPNPNNPINPTPNQPPINTPPVSYSCSAQNPLVSKAKEIHVMSRSEYIKSVELITGKAFINENEIKNWDLSYFVNGFNNQSRLNMDTNKLEGLFKAASLSADMAWDSWKNNCVLFVNQRGYSWSECVESHLKKYLPLMFRQNVSNTEIDKLISVGMKYLKSHEDIEYNHQFRGYLDTVTGNSMSASGWAVDNSANKRNVLVEFYVSEQGSNNEKYIGSALADKSRPDVNRALGVTGNHGYTFNLPKAVLTHNKNYTLHAYAVSINELTPNKTKLTVTQPKSFTANKNAVQATVVRNYPPELVTAVKTIFQVAFADPRFFLKGLHPMRGQRGSLVQAYELADRLAFYLAGAIPDKVLHEKAKDQSLLQSEVLNQEFERLLASNLDSFVEDFAGGWFSFKEALSSSDQSYNDLGQELKLSFKKMIQDNMPIDQLLSPGFTFLNSNLNSRYRLPGSVGNGFDLIQTQKRGGVLLNGLMAYLTKDDLGETHVIKRGNYVLNKVLCKSIPIADNSIRQVINSSIQNLSGRDDLTPAERLSIHRNSGVSCKSCHGEIDPIGLSLERLDASGAFRWKYGDGKDIVLNETLLGQRINTTYDLIDILSVSPQTYSCFAQRVSEYASMNIKQAWKSDVDCQNDPSGFVQGGEVGLKDLIKKLVMSENFKSI